LIFSRAFLSSFASSLRRSISGREPLVDVIQFRVAAFHPDRRF
jgi:hypothetical protein